jgi:hypothetical protein
VISWFGIMFFADPDGGIRHLRRAARPGDRMASVCWQDLTANQRQRRVTAMAAA